MTRRQLRFWSDDVLLFERVLQISPASPQAMMELGKEYRLRARLGDAERVLQAAVARAPNYDEARYQLGVVALQRDQLDGAAVEFDAALKINPRHAGAQFALGIVKHRRGEIASAISLYRGALQADPRSAARNNLAWLLATSPDDALRDGNEAVRLARGQMEDAVAPTAEMLDTLAAAYAEAGQFVQARQAAQKALALAAQAGPARLYNEIASRLEQYQYNRPYREPHP
jgi:tetratricopeptide (TPR) repeat protein